MATNKGPHDGDRNPNSRPVNSFAERYESTAFCQESSCPSLPPLRNCLTLPPLINHPLDPLRSGPLQLPLANVTQSNTLPNYHERATSQIPTTNYGVHGFQKACPIPTQEVLTDASSLRAKIDQQTMELKAQRTDLDSLVRDVHRLSRCFIWVGHQVNNLQSNIPIRHSASTAFPGNVPGRNGFENIGSLGAQRNEATPSASTAAPSVDTPFAPSFHYHTRQSSPFHQQPTSFRAFQPAIQEERGTPTSRNQTREDICERAAVHCSSGADVSINGKNGTGQEIISPVVEQQIFIMEHAVIKEEKWSQIHSAFCKRFPGATISRESFRHLYYSMRKSWGLPSGKGRKAEGKLQDKQAVRERIRRMRHAPY